MSARAKPGTVPKANKTAQKTHARFAELIRPWWTRGLLDRGNPPRASLAGPISSIRARLL
jgi:hypothetical protein